MYGLVNKAIEGLVRQSAGDQAWEEIKKKAGVTVDFFVSMNTYPDEITYSLVGAASEVLGLPSDEILKKFGEYWILYTAQEGYGNLLEMAGNNLKDFLMNLDNLHAQVGLSFPHLQPPSFRCTEIAADTLLLDYFSERAGLAPMVIGLLHGLGKRMNTTIEVSHQTISSGNRQHDQFTIIHRQK